MSSDIDNGSSRVKVIIVAMTLVVVVKMMINVCLSVAMHHDCRLSMCSLQVLNTWYCNDSSKGTISIMFMFQHLSNNCASQASCTY